MRAYVIFFFLFLTAPAISHAEAYKYTDEHGVVSFTDDLGKVPEAQRPQAASSESNAPPASPDHLLPEKDPQRWIDHPLSKYIIAFVALAIVMLVVQIRTKSLLLRLMLKLFFIGCLGAAIYSVLILQRQAPSLQKAAEPYLPSPAPIEKAQKAVKEVEENQKKEEALINSLLQGKK